MAYGYKLSVNLVKLADQRAGAANIREQRRIEDMKAAAAAKLNEAQNNR